GAASSVAAGALDSVSAAGASGAAAVEAAAPVVGLACGSLAGAGALACAPVFVCSWLLVAPSAGTFSSVAMKNLLHSSRFAAVHRACGRTVRLSSLAVSAHARGGRVFRVSRKARPRPGLCGDAGGDCRILSLRGGDASRQ